MGALKILLAPGSFALLAVAVIIGVMARRLRSPRAKRAGTLWVAAWISAYVILSLPVVAHGLHASLETPRIGAPDAALQGRPVVLLSGTARRYHAGDGRITVIPDVATTLRIKEAARVFHLLDAPALVISGAGPYGLRSPEIPATQRGLIEAGVPADRIVLEVESRDTRASAVAVRDLLRTRRWPGAVIVTSAQHVRRSVLAFRAVGIDVGSSAASVVPVRGGGGIRQWIPDADALLMSEACLHEYGGILYYKLRGWI